MVTIYLTYKEYCKMIPPLYPWQEECLKRWFANHGRGIVQAATGSGKTLLALTAAARLEKQLGQELTVKIVVPTGTLMRQWERALKSFLAGSADCRQDLRGQIGMQGAGYHASGCKYMIYVINSARYTLARQILADLRSGLPVLLIADECHRYESSQNRLIFEFLPYAAPYEDRFFSLGLSATLPSGAAQHYLASVLGRTIYSYGIRQAARMHTICPYDVFHVSLDFQAAESAEYQELSEQMNCLYRKLLRACPSIKGQSPKELFELLRTLAGDKDPRIARAAATYMALAYKRKSLVCMASSRILCARELVTLLPSDSRILIFGERIRQADELYRLLQKRIPDKVGRCHSQMTPTANQNTLNRFRDGELRILITCRSLDEGSDIPDASIGIILSGTSVKRQRIQRLGRIIRNAKGKESASLYYLHLADTTEDQCFLPDDAASTVHELEYRTDTHEFSNPPYDQAADRLLADFKSANADPAALAEAARCLRLGRIRADYLPGHCDIDSKIKEQTSVREKNYWICMKKIAAVLDSESEEKLPE